VGLQFSLRVTQNCTQKLVSWFRTHLLRRNRNSAVSIPTGLRAGRPKNRLLFSEGKRYFCLP